MELNKCGCGGRAELVTAMGESWAKCKSCDATGPMVSSLQLEQAAAAWNTAHPKAIRLEDIEKAWKHCRTIASFKSCPCEYEILCDVINFNKDKIDKLTAYVEGKNG